ncbi:MAG: hypothetical protein ACR2NM_16965 [Bythopirellula sp.]
MSKRKKQPSPKKKVSRKVDFPAESRASESLTVFWAITVLMVFAANLVMIAAHFYLQSHPDAEKIALLKGLLLFTAALVGSLSLIALPILYRVRRVPPPTGLAVFGACVAAAPILTALLGVWR